MKVFWLFVYLFSICYIYDTFLVFKEPLNKYLNKVAPSKYSSKNPDIFTVTLFNSQQNDEVFESEIKLKNNEFDYKPKAFDIDDGELIRDSGLLCLPESFGYSVSRGKFVFPDYNYPKCWEKTGQNGTYLHIDRKKNLLYMDCPSGKGEVIAGPVDSKKIARSNELHSKWEIKPYTSPIPASEIEFALGSCTDPPDYAQASMNPIFNQTAYKAAKSLTTSKPKLIYFLTLDSMSRRHMFRKTPKIISLLNALNQNRSSGFSVFDYKIHNILGPDSISNQVPIFGGIDKFVRDFTGNQNIDYLGESAIWNILRKKGFVSMLGLENCDNFFPGALGRMPQVDYSVGPFYCAVQKYSQMKFDKSFEKVQRCLGGYHTHYYILNYTDRVVEMNKGVNLWLYAHLNAAHEATGQHASTLNDDLTEYLQGFLNKYKDDFDVLIFLNGDHGMRYGNWFKDTDAYQENKLPALFIIASSTLLDQFPHSKYSLSTNSERLTSKLDLRKTALWVAGFNETFDKSANLIEDVISKARVCEDTFIQPWDCSCNRMELIEDVGVEMRTVLEYLKGYAEKTINAEAFANFKYPIGKYCKFVELGKIQKVYHVSISNIQEFFKLEIESLTQKGMIFQVNYHLSSDYPFSKRAGYQCENLIVNGKVTAKVRVI